MNNKGKTYRLMRSIHLYTSLSTGLLLLMYIITSYMMIYHDFFQPEMEPEQSHWVEYNILDEENIDWAEIKRTFGIKGRMYRQRQSSDGDQIAEFASVGSEVQIRIPANSEQLEITTSKKNVSANIIGFHRLRGYGGPIQYNIYAILLDLTGISLIIFALTGAILWLMSMKHDKVAWIIFGLGLIYVGSIIGYLLLI